MTRKKKLATDGDHSHHHHYPQISFSSLKVWLLTLLLGLMVEVVTTSSGASSEMGSCWRLKRKDGTCGHIQRRLVTREECCSGVQRRGWSSVSSTFNNSSFSSLSSSTSNSVISEQPTCFPCSMLCDGVKCGEDRKCVVRCGAPRCVCSPQCHLKNKEPVCGSDGRTYASECHLLKRACRKKKRVLVAHYGPCQTCSGVKCRGGKQCVLDEKMTPICIRCPTACSTPDKRPLCATDGRTYRSRCQLRQASCRAGYIIHRAYMGACHHSSTCDTVRCWGNQTCLTNVETQQPQCTECNDHLDSCRPSSRPVCASDGRMYPSWCAFRHEACRSGRALTPAIHLHCASNHTKADECKPTKHKKPKKLKNRLQELEEQQKEEILQHQALSSQVHIVERLAAQQEEIARIRDILPDENPNSIDGGGGGGSGQFMPEETVISSSTSSSSSRDKKKKHRRKKKKCKKSRKRRRKDRKIKGERESN